MKPVEMILATVDSLTDKEKQAVRDKLGMATPPPAPAPPVPACVRLGHKFKLVDEKKPACLGFIPGYQIHICTACGERRTITTGGMG